MTVGGLTRFSCVCSHEFPHDFRHGAYTWSWDPTKWCIMMCASLGLASDLVTADQSCVVSRQIEELESQIKQRLPSSEVTPLPSMSHAEFVKRSETERLFKIGRYICDVGEFDHHPGGQNYLLQFVGKDATQAFFGGFNRHTRGAQLLMRSMRVAQLSDCDPDEMKASDDLHQD